MTAKPFPILFIAPVDAGDAVAASGLIRRLYDEAPGARFTVVATRAVAPLFAEIPSLAKVILVKASGGRISPLGLWVKVRDQRWGLVLDAQGTGISSLLSRQRRAEWKAAPTAENRVVTAARLFDLANDPPPPSLFLSATHEHQADEALMGEGPILAVGPGADWVGRVWPSERLGQVAAKLLLGDGPLVGGRIVAFGGEADREAMLTAKFPLPRGRIIVRPYDQDHLTSYAWLKQVRLYIGCDNIWTQLAAAAGVPTLALFGPSDDITNGPWGPDCRTVRGPREFEDFVRLDPKFDQQISHMNDLSVDVVLKAAKDLLHATERYGG